MSGVRGAISAAIALGASLTLAACGETTMSAEEFLTSVEDEGVQLELTDDELVSEDPGKELYGLELKPLPGGGGFRTHGSLSVYDDTGAADSGLDACRASADLLCYQAANIVVVLEGGGIEAQRLAVAMEKLGE